MGRWVPCSPIFLTSLTIVFLQIKWENRFHGYHGGSCLVMVDGTDFLICEPKSFAKDFYSHKFAKAGLRYEVGVCIQTGLIVWINGPLAAGKYNNITIFRSKMIYELLDWEMVEVDQGYVGQLNKIRVKYELGVSENQFEAKAIVEFWGSLPLIPLLQCVNRLGFEICSVNSCQSEQGSLVTLI